MTPIQHDPARRIRRIQRWLGNVSEEFNGLPCYVACHKCPVYESCGCESEAHHTCESCRVSRDLIGEQIERADKLFSTELTWLCVHSHHQSVTIAEQKARIEELERQLTAKRKQVDNLTTELYAADWCPSPTDTDD